MNSVVRDRQKHLKSCALARFAFDFDSPPMGFDNHFAMKHADTNAAFLGGLERMKQAPLDKLMSHATAVIRNNEDDPTVMATGLYFDKTIRANGFSGVDQQISEHLFDLNGIELELGEVGKI